MPKKTSKKKAAKARSKTAKPLRKWEVGADRCKTFIGQYQRVQALKNNYETLIKQVNELKQLIVDAQRSLDLERVHLQREHNIPEDVPLHVDIATGTMSEGQTDAQAREDLRRVKGK